MAPSSDTPPDTTADSVAADSAAERIEERNILLLAAHQIGLRVAWIFKTESVIMPAFVDAIDGQAWVRGALPLLNNLGQSVPPLLMSDRLHRAAYKKRTVWLSTFLMSLPFLLLGLMWRKLDGSRPLWLPPFFLLLYTVFFAMNGMNVVSFATLQGKLIRAERRGRLMGISGIGGSILAILAAWWWLGPWLELPEGGYDRIFLFTGFGFLFAGALCLFVQEPPTRVSSSKENAWQLIHGAWKLVRHDDAFRKLCVAAMLCLSAQLLFPHYQALGRKRLGLEGREMMLWVIAQNAGTGVFSSIFGRMADRRGNRAALQAQAYLSAATPLAALGMAYGAPEFGQRYYWLAFALLGLTPVTLRTILNYTIELMPSEQHARSVSTLRMGMAIWLCLSPALGLVLEGIGFPPAFVTVAVLLIVGGIWTARLPEPRFR